MYKLRGQINNYYFNLLLIDRQKELLSNYSEIIAKKISSMQSALDNGVITRSDIDVLTSEKIRLAQQIGENEIRKASLLKILTDLTGIQIDTSTRLILPALREKISRELSRPELQLFDLRKEQLAAGMKLTDSKRMPKAFGFATIGYGNPPGNNFFRDEFASYYILGAGIMWNIFDWNKSRNEKEVMSLQQNIIDARKTDLADNLNRLLESKKAEIKA
jgi:outer membrane protein TolC